MNNHTRRDHNNSSDIKQLARQRTSYRAANNETHLSSSLNGWLANTRVGNRSLGLTESVNEANLRGNEFLWNNRVSIISGIIGHYPILSDIISDIIVPGCFWQFHWQREESLRIRDC